MTDPIAEAAAQQAANEPSLLEKAQETIHQLEEKLEHMIHPDAAPSSMEPAQEVAASEAKESQASHVVAESESVTSSSASPASQESATPAPSASVAIREHLQTIRSHLSLMGFEQSSVAVIHGAMDEIEKLL